MYQLDHLQHLADENHGDVGSLSVPQDYLGNEARLREGENDCTVERSEQHRQEGGAAEPDHEERDEGSLNILIIQSEMLNFENKQAVAVPICYELNNYNARMHNFYGDGYSRG